MNTSTSIKSKLHNQCLLIASQKIELLQNAINEAQDAANNETKSSAGDKHETSRAMAQLETEKLTSQLTEALKIKQFLDGIITEKNGETIKLGSVVYTNKGNFYISASLGKINFEKESYFAISPISPIGKLMLTKKEKDSFSFNGNSYEILSVI